MGDYKGITIMPSLYKIRSNMAERLREEIEEKDLLSLNQTDFRKGTLTIDNIYIYIY